jgi:hypothetical protein
VYAPVVQARRVSSTGAQLAINTSSLCKQQMCCLPPCVEARLLLLIGVAPPAQLVRVLAAACLSGVASPSSTTTFLTDLSRQINIKT